MQKCPDKDHDHSLIPIPQNGPLAILEKLFPKELCTERSGQVKDNFICLSTSFSSSTVSSRNHSPLPHPSQVDEENEADFSATDSQSESQTQSESETKVKFEQTRTEAVTSKDWGKDGSNNSMIPRFMRHDLCSNVVAPLGSSSLTPAQGQSQNQRQNQGQGINWNQNLADQPKVGTSKDSNASVSNEEGGGEGGDSNEDPMIMIQKLQDLFDKTGMPIKQESGQRSYGPPVDWEGPPPPKGCELFVGKLPRHIFEPHLIPLFEKIGPIYQLRMMIDFQGFNRGFCFIQYTKVCDAQKAIETLNNYEIAPHRRIGVVKSVNNTRLFLGGIPTHLDEKEIFTAMDKVCDGVLKVIICPPLPGTFGYHNQNQSPKSSQSQSRNSSGDLQDRKNRGYAFVEFVTHKSACMARRKMFPKIIRLWGRDIHVDWAVDGTEIRNLHVTNVAPETSSHAIKKLFNSKSHDGVESVNHFKTFTFVHFFTREQAVEAKTALDGTEVDGRRIQINWAKPTSKYNHHLNHRYDIPNYGKGHSHSQSPGHIHYPNRNQNQNQHQHQNQNRNPPKVQDQSNKDQGQGQCQGQGQGQDQRSPIKKTGSEDIRFSSRRSSGDDANKTNTGTKTSTKTGPGPDSNSSVKSQQQTSSNCGDVNDRGHDHDHGPSKFSYRAKNTRSNYVSREFPKPRPKPFNRNNEENNCNSDNASVSSSNNVNPVPVSVQVPAPISSAASVASSIGSSASLFTGTSTVTSGNFAKSHEPSKRPPLLPLPISSEPSPVPLQMPMQMPMSMPMSMPMQMQMPMSAQNLMQVPYSLVPVDMQQFEVPYGSFKQPQQQQQPQHQPMQYLQVHPQPNLHQSQQVQSVQETSRYFPDYSQPQQPSVYYQHQVQHQFVHQSQTLPVTVPPPASTSAPIFDVNVGFGFGFGVGFGYDHNSPAHHHAQVNHGNVGVSISGSANFQNQNHNPSPNPWVINSHPNPIPHQNLNQYQNQKQYQDQSLGVGYQSQDPIQELLALCHSQGWGEPSYLPVCYQNGNSLCFGCCVYLTSPVTGEKKFDTHNNYRSVDEAKAAAAEGLCFYLKKELTCAQFVEAEGRRSISGPGPVSVSRSTPMPSPSTVAPGSANVNEGMMNNTQSNRGVQVQVQGQASPSHFRSQNQDRNQEQGQCQGQDRGRGRGRGHGHFRGRGRGYFQNTFTRSFFSGRVESQVQGQNQNQHQNQDPNPMQGQTQNQNQSQGQDQGQGHNGNGHRGRGGNNSRFPTRGRGSFRPGNGNQSRW